MINKDKNPKILLPVIVHHIFDQILQKLAALLIGNGVQNKPSSSFHFPPQNSPHLKVILNLQNISYLHPTLIHLHAQLAEMPHRAFGDDWEFGVDPSQQLFIWIWLDWSIDHLPNYLLDRGQQEPRLENFSNNHLLADRERIRLEDRRNWSWGMVKCPYLKLLRTFQNSLTEYFQVRAIMEKPANILIVFITNRHRFFASSSFRCSQGRIPSQYTKHIVIDLFGEVSGHCQQPTHSLVFRKNAKSPSNHVLNWFARRAGNIQNNIEGNIANIF